MSVQVSTHGPTYIYNGEGAWKISVDQTQEMLETILDSRGIKQVNTLSNLDKDAQLVVIPGGSAAAISTSLGITEQKVSQYLKDGGRFLGICAGAIIATQIMFTKPPVIDIPENSSVTELQKTGKVSGLIRRQFAWSLYLGTCIAPHVVKNNNPYDFNNFCAVNVIPTDEKVVNTFKVCHYSGPAFLETPPEAKVLLRYLDPIEIHKVESKFDATIRANKYYLTGEKIREERPVAAISYPYGNGKIVLTGVHPEINPDTFPEKATQDGFMGELPNEMAESEPGRIAFVDRIFKELNLKNTC